MQPIISFVINVEQSIERCIDSVRAQTRDDIEIVVVDDCSDDETPSLIRAAVHGDARCHVYRHNRNQGAHLARRTGVAHTTGRYVVFVDGDDELEPTSCEVLAAVASARSFDILRFGRVVVPECGTTPEMAYAEERSFNNAIDADGGGLLASVFSERAPVRNTWCVIDCLFVGDLVRDAFSRMTADAIGRMQDSYEFFGIASMATRMLAFTEFRALRYHFGSGVSGYTLEALDAFDRGQRGIHASLAAVLAYARMLGDEQAVDCAEWFERTVWGIVGREWSGRLAAQDQSAGLERLRGVWGDQPVAYMLLDPLTARAQWFWDHGHYPSCQDEYARWSGLLALLTIPPDASPVVAERLGQFRSLSLKLDHRERQRLATVLDRELQSWLAVIEQRRRVEEQRLREERRHREEEERRAQEELRRQEEARILKSNSLPKKTVDFLFPEQSRPRTFIRRLTRALLGR